MKPEYNLYDRREFFGAAAKAAAILGLAQGKIAGAQPDDNSNPFAYNLAPLEKTDPKLIAYKEIARWPAPRKEPKRIAIGPDDRIYLCAGNYVSVLNTGGQPLLELALPATARCAVAHKDGTIFAATRDHIEVFDAKGQRLASWEPTGRRSWITGLAVAANYVFAADSLNRIVLRYDHSGKVTGRIGERNAEKNIPGFIVPSPYLDVKIHPDGLLRVNNPGRHQVEAYTFDGELEGQWGKPSAAIDCFCGCCNPIAITTLPGGRIVTGEKGLPRVKIYTADGEFESVVAGPEAFPENARECSNLNDCTRGGMDIAADSRGQIYIIDFVTAEMRVMKRKT